MLGVLGAIAGAVVPVRLAESQHAASVASSAAIHQQSVGRSVLQAQEAAEFERSLHDRALRRAQRIHYETVAYELDIARREVARDMLQQKNNVIQTLMVVNTVMIIAVYSLLVQGYAPADNPGALPESLTLLFTALCGLSVVSHVASVLVAFKLNARAIQFQMHNPHVRYRPCGLAHIEFDAFFTCHCARLEQLSLALFYAGATLALATCACFVWTLDLGRNGANANAATSIASLIVAALGIATSVWVFYREE